MAILISTSLNTKTFPNKEAFYLRHTARLPSSTSQLVLFHHLFCIHFWGVGGPLPCSLLGGGGGPLPCSLPVGSTSVFTSGGRGIHFHVQFWGGGSTSMFTSWGVHFCVHFQGGSTSMFTSRGSDVTYPIMLLYTTIDCPSASWAKFTWPPPPKLNRLTDRQT